VLLLDEPDNYLDIPTRAWLEEQIRQCRSTILMVSHDRTLLERVSTKIVSSRARAAGCTAARTPRSPRRARSARSSWATSSKRWNDEERRLFQHMKIMKQRAAQNFKNATKANAAETRWEKFVAAGPPPPPVPDQQIHVRLRGADAARRVVKLEGVSIGDLFLPFSDEVYHGERVGLIGPNGTGKTHLLSALKPAPARPTTARSTFGPRTSVGMFTQINDRPEFRGRTCLEIVRDRRVRRREVDEGAGPLRPAGSSPPGVPDLSGGQKARLEILCLELEGHNVLLLDEPTDNLDVESSEALEQALDGFEGTVIAVSHDRTFLSTFDRFVMITDDGEVYACPTTTWRCRRSRHPIASPGCASRRT
jgi:ATPase subunit of ABC transporter with duplicated ATPase domains